MHTQAGSTLLGDHGQLCHAFWHVPTTPEAGFHSPVCLRVACEGNECAGKGTVLVARLQVTIRSYSPSHELSHQKREVESWSLLASTSARTWGWVDGPLII